MIIVQHFFFEYFKIFYSFGNIYLIFYTLKTTYIIIFLIYIFFKITNKCKLKHSAIASLYYTFTIYIYDIACYTHIKI